jgi:hypothetical protein
MGWRQRNSNDRKRQIPQRRDNGIAHEEHVVILAVLITGRARITVAVELCFVILRDNPAISWQVPTAIYALIALLRDGCHGCIHSQKVP